MSYAVAGKWCQSHNHSQWDRASSVPSLCMHFFKKAESCWNVGSEKNSIFFSDKKHIYWPISMFR